MRAVVDGIKHEGDCLGTLCPSCGCCIHKTWNDPCPGCTDARCECWVRDGGERR